MYRRRVIIFMLIMFAGLLGMAARLFQLQVLQGQDYRRQFEQAAGKVSLLAPLRGQIMDRSGVVLAMDQGAYDLCLDYRFIVADPDWVGAQVRRIARERRIDAATARSLFDRQTDATWRLVRSAGASEEELEAAVSRIMRRVANLRSLVGGEVSEERQPQVVVAGLDEERATAMRIALGDTIGASVVPSRRRWYPQGAVAAHVVGFIGQVSARDQQSANLPPESPWLDRMLQDYLDNDLIGKAGAERMCETLLRGRRGYLRYAAADAEPELHDSVNGSDVRLTIDVELQRRIGEAFPQGVNGAAVVVSVKSGQVLALVSIPTYDANSYRQEYARLSKDVKDLPLQNRAVRGQYPPGSTAKPVTALAALGDGKLTPETTYNCRGYLYSPDSFRCWIWKHGAGHGPMDTVSGLKNSCNVYFYHAGELVGAQRLGDWFRAFGWGELPGTGLPEEDSGFVPTEQWLRGAEGRAFTPADARFMGIGQGLVTITPLQAADAIAAIARGGRFVSPVLMMGAAPATARDLVLRPSDVQAVHKGMYEVANDSGGTAYKVFHSPEVPPLPVEVCGKTGTAQTPPQRVDTDGDGVVDFSREGDMAWFVGFAPYGDPKIAFAVVLEYVDGGGAKNAGPVARELVRACADLGYFK